MKSRRGAAATGDKRPRIHVDSAAVGGAGNGQLPEPAVVRANRLPECRMVVVGEVVLFRYLLHESTDGEIVDAADSRKVGGDLKHFGPRRTSTEANSTGRHGPSFYLVNELGVLHHFSVL